MRKLVRETAAGRSISAWIILKRGTPIAKIQAHYSNSGVVTVDVWDDASLEMQYSSASGYRYDKLSAALRGLTIDGITLVDHAQSTPKLQKRYNNAIRDGRGPVVSKTLAQIERAGGYLANYDSDTGGFMSIYQHAGLEVFNRGVPGYTLIQAI